MISASLLSCVPKLIVPNIEYQSKQEVVISEPNCTQEITNLRNKCTEENALSALKCQRDTIQHWEDAYEIIESQIGTLKNE